MITWGISKVEKMRGFWQSDLKNLMMREAEFEKIKKRDF